MAGDDEAAALAATADGALQGIIAFKPAFFRGTKDDSVTVQQWCSTLTKKKLSANWDDQRTIDCATENLREEAAVWYQNTKSGFRAEKAQVTTTWLLFQEAIKKRFSLDRTAIQKVNLIRELHQRTAPAEKVASFFERVHMAVRKSFGDIITKMEDTRPQVYAEQEERTAYADGVEEVQKAVIQVMFLAGLKDDIRQQLQANSEFETLTLNELRNHSIRIEDSKTRLAKEPTPLAVGAITVDTTDATTLQLAALQKEIAAINAFNKGGKKGKKKDDKKQDATTAQKRPRIQDIPVHQRTTWIRCHACKQWGMHMARECTRTASEISMLSPQDEKVKPTTQAHDRLFPNPN